MDEDENDCHFGFCQLCNGPLHPLGVLGRLLHLTCQNCGMQFSRPAPAQEEQHDDEIG